MLYIYSINFFYNDLLLLELSLLLFAILIIVNKNPIISILYLIALFLGVAVYMIILGLSFIGLSYLLVYVGAVSIIFLFILMLIDIRISELQNDTNNNIVLGIIISLIYFNLFFSYNYNNNLNINVVNNLNVKQSIFNVWDGSLIENYDIISIGNILYTNTSIWLILSLLILLLSMIGSIKINIKQ